MQKIKWAFIAMALIISVYAALALHPPGCETYTQYRRVGSSYVPAGTLGYDYICHSLPGTCTYYKPNPLVENYVACQPGLYEAIPHAASK